jgi:propanol-preferring alcohol dehydrogenase
MSKMRAYRLLEWGRPPEFVEVDVPSPGPGEVLVRVAAAGICGSDLHLLHATAGMLPYSPPFTLGHENTGWVEKIGAGVKSLSVGEAVLASSSTSCGHCDPCVAGRDNYCTRQVSVSSRMMTMKVRGIGLDGGFAPYMLAPERDLVPLGGLDPFKVAPLACAGATSYHAVVAAAPVLTPGETCLVIGVGGLGSFAIQHARLTTEAKVVAVDISPTRLEVATKMGAHHVLTADDAAPAGILSLTDGQGAAAVLDFVGTSESLTLANQVVKPGGKVVVPGIGMESIAFGWGLSAPGCDYSLGLGFTNKELREVVALARLGSLTIDVERFAFDDIPTAMTKLAEGQLRGRAVIEIGTPPASH